MTQTKDTVSYVMLSDLDMILDAAESRGTVTADTNMEIATEARRLAMECKDAASATEALRNRCIRLAKDLSADTIRAIEDQKKRDSLSYQAAMREATASMEGDMARMKAESIDRRAVIQHDIDDVTGRLAVLKATEGADPGETTALRARRSDLTAAMAAERVSLHKEMAARYKKYSAEVSMLRAGAIEVFDDACRRQRAARGALRMTLDMIAAATADRLPGIEAELTASDR